jgi:hypothetical protein
MPHLLPEVGYQRRWRVFWSGHVVTLAGNVVIVVLAVALIAYAIRSNRYRLRWEKPLREEIRDRPATSRWRVELQEPRGAVFLSVHGDVFEVAQKIPVLDFVNGTDYSYWAPDTTVEMVHGFLHDWIEIRGLPGTGAVPIRIGRRKTNPHLWDVLLSAGAHPIGPPPER